MTNFSVLIGSLMSILGMGSGLASQGLAMRQQINPQQAQVYQQPGQSCALQQGDRYLNGTFVVVEHADGRRTLECIPSGNAN